MKGILPLKVVYLNCSILIGLPNMGLKLMQQELWYHSEFKGILPVKICSQHTNKDMSTVVMNTRHCNLKLLTMSAIE